MTPSSLGAPTVGAAFDDPAEPDLLTRQQAIARLGVQKATLYTYVSRGWVRSMPQKGSRNRLFSAEDVERLRSRSAAQSGRAPRGESVLRWGGSVLTSTITQLTPEGPLYRGRSALELTRNQCRFENVAQLLWSGRLATSPLFWQVEAPSAPDPAAAHDLATSMARVLLDGSQPEGEVIAGQKVLTTMASGLCGAAMDGASSGLPGSGIAEALVARFAGKLADPDTIEAVNAALVLCADFELAPATFAARIAASAGSDLSTCVLVGVLTHIGAHVAGNVIDAQRMLFTELSEANIEEKLRATRSSGVRHYGFNHPLFPNGDPRATALIELATRKAAGSPTLDLALIFLEQARDRFGLLPGLGIALTVLCHAFELESAAPLAIWTLGRSAGLIAHVLEQQAENFTIRPRASYSAKGFQSR